MSDIVYRRDIDGLRSLAVVPVVLNHAGLSAFPGGFVGVDIFFVISGFLITGILARELDERRFSIIGFYERRARRILPALMAMLATCMVGGWFLLLPDEFVRLAKSVVATLAFSSNIWFWYSAGNYFGDGVAFEPLLHTWSLAVEEQFYLFFPLLLWLLAFGPRRFWPTIVGLICLVSFALSVWATTAHPVTSFYLVPTRVWELGLGSLLAIGTFPHLRNAALAELTGLAGLILIVGSVALIGEDTPFPGLAALPPCLGAFALIWSGADRQTRAARFLSLAPLVWVGLISYSLYLWHWPVLVAARLWHGSLDLPNVTVAVCITLAVALAWLSWRFVEQPFRRAGSGLRMDRKAIFVVSGAAMAAATAVSAVVALAHGFPQRMSQTTLAAYETTRDRDALGKACMSLGIGAGPCVIVPPAKGLAPDVVFWGDSHAGAMLPGMERWLIKHGLTGVAFTKAACPPLPGLVRINIGEYHRCDAQNEAVLDYLAAHAPDARVILAARWAIAVEGDRSPGEAGGAAVLAPAGGSSPGIEGNAALTSASLDRLLGTLAGKGHRVTIIGGVPEMSFDVPKALARKDLLAKVPTAPSRQAVEKRNRRANAMLIGAAARHGAELRPIIPIMCDTRCHFAKDGITLYRDDDHLSIEAARSIIPRALDGLP